MCTGISLGNKDLGINSLSRNLDFTYMQDCDIIVLPRSFSWTGLAKGEKIQNKYSICGMGGPVAEYTFNEAMNEKGLAGAMLYLPGFAKYNTEIDETKLNLAPFEILKYMLGTCSNVDEVIAVCKNLRVMDIKVPEFNMALPVHFIFTDKNGDTIIVETANCEVQVYTENTATLTNSPTYDWHLNNLANYLSFSRENPTNTINGIELKPKGEGYGLKLPGGVNPIDRFVRAAIGRELMVSKGLITSEQEMILHAFKLLDNVAIPQGFMDMQEQADYSIYKICMSISELKYYYKTYKADTLQMFDFSKYVDVTEPMEIPISNEFIVHEMEVK